MSATWNEIYRLAASFPGLETFYILNRNVRLRDDIKLPSSAVRFYGNCCTFVEIPLDADFLPSDLFFFFFIH